MGDEEYEGIAIIGMAGRFPGAGSVDELWANLVEGKEGISFFSDAELAASGLDVAELTRRGPYVRARGVLKDADCFDAGFFGVRPKEAQVMDPQQRLFLEVCWAALERAGYAPNQIRRAVGVFAGASPNTYSLNVLSKRPDLVEMVGADLVMFGNERDYLATRVAYTFGLRGPAINVSTACSTSLVAVCQACQSLLTYQCDMALAGATSVRVPQQRGYYYQEGNIRSPDGHTRTFDAQAAGTVSANGVGVVVLKRLADAVNDGDHIYAVIKGAALNNDGSQRVSFSAPGVKGQAEVIAMAHALAGVDPETITYVEAHGTATPLGDPIEVAALTRAFRLGTDAKQFCAIGSIKSNLGHLDAAAGVAGLIKTGLALHYKKIPPSLHFTKPNPKLDIENSPFFVNAALKDWKTKPGVPRRAGVSSFGMGGTNAHVVLEEAPDLTPSGPSRPWQLLVFSAKTAPALDQATTNLSQYLKEIARHADAAKASRELADAAFTLKTGRSDFPHRRLVVCQDPSDGAAALDASDPKRVFEHHQPLREPPVVFMFPGQGSQYPGMGRELYHSEPVFRAEVDRCADWLRPLLQTDLRAIMFPAPGSDKEAEQLLVQTQFTQPALFVIEYALAKLWMSWGIKPAAMIGHSVGEYVAGCVAGVFALEDALSLVARRGALIQRQPRGAMLSVRLSEKELLPLLNQNGQLDIAAINSPTQCVMAGSDDAIAAFEQKLASLEIMTRRLQTSHAFHSQMMEPVIAPFTELLRQVKLNEPQIPYVSNVTARWITPAEARTPEYWAGHVRQTVRFADGIVELMKGATVLLEVGPGQTLSALSRQHPAKPLDQIVLASLPLTGVQEPRGVLEALGRLWMTGVAVDWQGFYAHERRRRVVLPSYPFEPTRFWPEPVHGPGPSPEAIPFGTSVERKTPPPPSSDEMPPSRGPQAVAPSAAESTPALARKDRLLAAARSLLRELSGHDFSTVDSDASFLELGLDSLSLAQAALLLERRFGVSISFRQLMEELSSLDAVASYLDEKLPPETLVQKPATPPSPTPVVAADSQRAALEEIWRQQQQLTNQVLELLGRQTARTPPHTPPSISTAIVVPPPASEVKSQHGPFKPISRGADLTLSPAQQRALDALIARYTARTAGSKKLAMQNRPDLADPRSVAGFKQLWKEMVYPIVTTRSEGSKVRDVDANTYVDFVMGFGASLFGHRPPFVVQAVRNQLEQGFEIGPIPPLAGEVAALVKEFTGMQRVVFANTGSEAVMAAIRSARAVTGRDKIVVFAGSYHGVFDEVLFRPITANQAGQTVPIAPGIPSSALSQVIVLDYGNPESLEILRARGSEIAAVLVEPVQSRRLDLVPREFLHELRRVTAQTGSALIFDEMVTGFRIHPGGAQAYFDIRADLATYGKVIGGGLPIGVVAGHAKFMDALDGGQWQYGDQSFPEVGVTFFAGTFVRHPLMLAAAKAVLTHLKQEGPELQQRLNDRTGRLADEIRTIVDEFRAPYHVTQFGSFMHLTSPPEHRLAGLLFYLLRDRGIHAWENRAFVITTAHTDDDFARLTDALRESLSEMCSGELLPPSASYRGEASRSPLLLPAEASSSSKHALTAAVKQCDVDGAFPLTESQKEIWLATQMGGDAALAYNESLRFEFRGAFDVAAFRTAIAQVVKRHPILLASISPTGESQQIKAGTTLDVPLLDLSGMEQREQERQLVAIVGREVTDPFDLVAGPLFRVRIARLSDDRHVVTWTVHHIACDGWSVGVLIRELAVSYTALMQQIQPVLPTPFAFREYALSGQPTDAEAGQALAFWRRQFDELSPPLELPTDRPRPPIRSAKAAARRWSVDASVQESLKRIAGQQRTTLVVVLMAALKGLFYRLTGETDLVVAIACAGQAVSGKPCLVGQCVNTLPIRTRLKVEASFLENVTLVKKGVLDAYDHHRTSLGSIIQHLTLSRDLSRPTLVNVYFNVDRDTSDVTFDGVEFTCEPNAKQALHFDLFFNVIEKSRGLSLLCTYNTDLFDATTIERWLKYYDILLQGIATNPTEVVGKLPLLPEPERRDLIVDRNRTHIEFPQKTLVECFEDRVREMPEARAVTFAREQLTYRELSRRTTQLAHRLKRLGVGPNVLVGLAVERSLHMLVGLLGILKAGGAYVPLDPSFPEDRLAYMVEDSRIPVLVTHRRLDQRLRTRPELIIRLDSDWQETAKESADPHTLPRVNPETLAYVLYTSGSTGKPNGVEIQHSALMNVLLSMQREPGFTAADTMLAVTTLSFDIAGLELYLPLISGGRVAIASADESHDPRRLMDRLRNGHCTVMQATPATWRALVETGWKGSSTLKVLCGGESLPRDLARELLPRCRELWNVYGPTETTIWSTIHRVTSADGPIPIGRPIANTEAFVLDAYRNPVPVGAAGELYLGGAGLARSYMRRPELTDRRFVESPFRPGTRLYRTGDLARWVPGPHLECLGRTDTQVKLRGFRIELGEIEAALSSHEAIAQCAVIVRDDAQGDKSIVAYFELRQRAVPSTADLRAHLTKSLPEYMVPSTFVPLNKLPMTPNGKIDRKALPAPAGQDIQVDREFVSPRDPLEQALTDIWTKVLRVKRVGLRDNFFDRGGHSLAAVRMLMEVRKLTGKDLPLATLFQASTIESFAALLRQDGWTSSWASLVPIQPVGQRPPLFLVHGAEGNVLLYKRLTQYLDPDQPVFGLQSKGLSGDGFLNATVEGMASEYVREVLAVQPRGPYFLGGYCFGGTVAFEMAQQLSAMGKNVGHVIMLGTYNQAVASSFLMQSSVHFLQDLWFHAANVASIPWEDGKKFLRDKVDTELERGRIRLHAAARALAGALRRPTRNSYPHLAVWKANDQALDRYVPRPYRGKVTVIREKGHFLGHSNPTMGWDTIVPEGVDIRELPVRPKGMLVEPFCRLLAATVTSCLEDRSHTSSKNMS